MYKSCPFGKKWQLPGDHLFYSYEVWSKKWQLPLGSLILQLCSLEKKRQTQYVFITGFILSSNVSQVKDSGPSWPSCQILSTERLNTFTLLCWLLLVQGQHEEILLKYLFVTFRRLCYTYSLSKHKVFKKCRFGRVYLSHDK
jgi:hypothetical protein